MLSSSSSSSLLLLRRSHGIILSRTRQTGRATTTTTRRTLGRIQQQPQRRTTIIYFSTTTTTTTTTTIKSRRRIRRFVSSSLLSSSSSPSPSLYSSSSGVSDTKRMVSTTTTGTSSSSSITETATADTTSSAGSRVPSPFRFVSFSRSSGGPTLAAAAAAAVMISLTSLCIGYVAGRNCVQTNDQHEHDHRGDDQRRVLPNGLPRTCCEKDTDENKKEVKKKNKKEELSDKEKQLLRELRRICGKENVMDGRESTTKTLPYLKGARIGSGYALAIITPTRLQHVVDAVQMIADSNGVIIPQGQNTGLTGGSVPRPRADNDSDNDDSRPVIVISMKHLNRIFPIDDGERVVCLGGVGLAQLQHWLDTYLPGRESHSTLGSTFLNPTTGAGVAYGSGGTQLRKGPAYTERALYVRVQTNKWNENVVEVINTLNIDQLYELQYPKDDMRRKLDTISSKVDSWSRYIEGDYLREMLYTKLPPKQKQLANKGNKENNKKENKVEEDLSHLIASDINYSKRLCVNDDSVSRYNADIRGPDLNRSEGKVIILASVHDTFPKPIKSKTYWISFDTLQGAYEFRKSVCLHNSADLPISLEYMDNDSFCIINESARLLGNVIKFVGTSSSIVRHLWNIKLYIEALPYSEAPYIVDKFLYMINPVVPSIVPRGIMKNCMTHQHHIAMTVGEYGNDNMDRLIQRMKQFQQQYNKSNNNNKNNNHNDNKNDSNDDNGDTIDNEKMKIYECKNTMETKAVNAFRFVAAPAFRTYCIGNQLHGYSVDYALPKNYQQIPPLTQQQQQTQQQTQQQDDNTSSSKRPPKLVPIRRMRYSHFGCNVVHEDIAYDSIMNTADDVEHAKHEFKIAIETSCNGKLPAEHGHGVEYNAPMVTKQRWKNMDPLNIFNPGIGGLSSKYKYQE